MFKYIILFTIIHLISADFLEYNENFGRKAFIVASSAYSSEASSCFERSPLSVDYRILVDSESDCAREKPACRVLAVANDYEKIITIAIKGPNRIDKIDKDFIKGIRATTEFLGFGLVDMTFLRAHSEIWKTISAMLTSANSTGYHILFTGHSTGAGLATLSALQSYKIGIPTNLIHLYTFGEPRIGNKALANNVDRVIHDSWRIVNELDSVPHMTPCRLDEDKGKINECDDFSASAPHHHGTEVWYTNGMTKGYEYKVCTLSDEDTLCSNTLKSYKDAHHLEYFDIKLTKYDKDKCVNGSSSNTIVFLLTFSSFIMFFFEYK